MPKNYEFPEHRLKVDKNDSSKVHSYVIHLLIVDETFDTVKVFVRNDSDFEYLSQLIMNYYDCKITSHAPHYNFVLTWDEKERSFTFANDLEDSITLLKGIEAISNDLYKEITYRLRIYNKSASTTEITRGMII